MNAASKSPNRLRKPTSITLIVLAGIVLAAAFLTIYAERNIFNSARFADHAQTALSSPAVRELAADRITDQVIEQVEPDAIAIKPVLDSATAAIIDTASFNRVFRSAILQLHRAALTNDLDSAVLVVANVGVLVSQALQRLSPEFADEIPDDLDAKLINVAKGGFVTDIAQTADANESLAWLLPALALLLFAAGIAVAPDRRVAVSGVGLSIAGAGALVGALYFSVDTIALHSAGASGSLEREAAMDIWNAFLGGIFIGALGLAVTGAAIAAAASSTLRTAEIDRRIHALVLAAARPPQTAARRAIWSVAVALLGVWTVIAPLDVVTTAASLVGVYLIFRGLNELITLAMPNALPAGERAAQGGKQRRFSTSMLRIVAGFAVICLVVVSVTAVFIGGEGLDKLGITQNVRACNGDESLCDKPFNDVAFAMTHNSMADLTFPGWIFPEQEAPISQQLSDGIRGLMIDAYYGFPGRRVYTDGDLSSPTVREGLKEEFGAEFVDAADRIRRSISRPKNTQREIFLCHGFCELGALSLRAALAQTATFLEQNPREVITIVFEDYVRPADLAAEIEKSGVADHVYRGAVKPPWPTLREMIDKDQRVLLLTENAEPTVPWMHRAYDVMQETPFKFTSVAQLEDPASCDPLRGEPENSVFLVNHWIDSAPAPRVSQARRANSRRVLEPRIKRCQRIRGMKANFISVNFYQEGDLLAEVDRLNGVR